MNNIMNYIILILTMFGCMNHYNAEHSNSNTKLYRKSVCMDSTITKLENYKSDTFDCKFLGASYIDVNSNIEYFKKSHMIDKSDSLISSSSQFSFLFDKDTVIVYEIVLKKDCYIERKVYGDPVLHEFFDFRYDSTYTYSGRRFENSMITIHLIHRNDFCKLQKFTNVFYQLYAKMAIYDSTLLYGKVSLHGKR